MSMALATVGGALGGVVGSYIANALYAFFWRRRNKARSRLTSYICTYASYLKDHSDQSIASLVRCQIQDIERHADRIPGRAIRVFVKAEQANQYDDWKDEKDDPYTPAQPPDN